MDKVKKSIILFSYMFPFVVVVQCRGKLIPSELIIILDKLQCLVNFIIKNMWLKSVVAYTSPILMLRKPWKRNQPCLDTQITKVLDWTMFRKNISAVTFNSEITGLVLIKFALIRKYNFIHIIHQMDQIDFFPEKLSSPELQ